MSDADIRFWDYRIADVALLFCRVRLNGKKPKDKAYPKEVQTIGDAIRKRRLDLGLKTKRCRGDSRVRCSERPELGEGIQQTQQKNDGRRC
jgi:hypothetical protein